MSNTNKEEECIAELKLLISLQVLACLAATDIVTLSVMHPYTWLLGSGRKEVILHFKVQETVC